MMATVAKNLPLVLMGVAGVVFLAFLFYSFTRPDEEDEEEEDFSSTMKMSGSHLADTGEVAVTDDMRARKSRMIALKDSLEKSLQTRAGVKASSLDRLAMPWFMLVGTEGSGKKSLLASTGLPLPYGPPVEVDSARKDAGRWWLFEDAVVVEAPTAKPAPKAPTPSEITAAAPAVHIDTSEGWNNLLHLLRRERPDSPLNGIIVTVSAADLVGTRRKSPEEIAEQAELLKAFLEKTRRVLGVRLPLHLIITRCDAVPGFRSFAETLPDARRDDIFGWASPAALEKPFDAGAVDGGFVSLRKSLESLHDELLAAPETVHDADGLFVFVSEFAEIQDPLRDFVTKLMPSGERRPSLFFRGVYFTGDASAFAAKQAKVDDESATLHISIEATEAESHSLVFLRSLFSDKIFMEAGLARTAARLRVSRDVRVIVAQAAAILIALLGGVGLWASINGVHRSDKTYVRGLRAGASEVTRALAGVAIDLDELKRPGLAATSDSVRRAKDAAVISLVAEMRGVSADRIRSPFVPWSLVSPLPRAINRTMVASIQDQVLPVIRQRLQERVNRLMGTGPRSPAAVEELDPSDPNSLTTYLKDVRALTRNIARYNSLAKKDSGQVSDLTGLMDYLFSQRPADSLVASGEFQNALKAAAAPALIIVPAQTASVVARAVRLIALVSDSAARQLSSRSPAANPDADLDALRRLNDLAVLTDSKKGIVAMVSDSTILGLRIAREVRDSIGAYLGYAAIRVLRDTMSTAAARQRLESVLTGLFSLRLLEPGEGREVDDDLRAGQNLRWDVGQLELAFALRSEQVRAGISTGDAFPSPTAARLKTVFDQQMRVRVIDLAASAQRFTPDSSNGPTAIRSETENLEAASTRLVRLSRMLDSLRESSTGKKLLAAGARQAEHVLAMSQIILDSANYLAPHPIVVAAWRGGSPIGHAALGVADSGEANFRLNREQLPAIVAVAAGAGPATQYLRQPVIGLAMLRVPKLFADWSAIEASVAKYSATDFSSDGQRPSDRRLSETARRLRRQARRPFPIRRFRQGRDGSRRRPGRGARALCAIRRVREVRRYRLAQRPACRARRTAGLYLPRSGRAGASVLRAVRRQRHDSPLSGVCLCGAGRRRAEGDQGVPCRRSVGDRSSFALDRRECARRGVGLWRGREGPCGERPRQGGFYLDGVVGAGRACGAAKGRGGQALPSGHEDPADAADLSTGRPGHTAPTARQVAGT